MVPAEKEGDKVALPQVRLARSALPLSGAAMVADQEALNEPDVVSPSVQVAYTLTPSESPDPTPSRSLK